MKVRFDKLDEGTTKGRRRRVTQTLAEIEMTWLNAHDGTYEPQSVEEAEAIKAIVDPTQAVVLEETDTPEKAYSRAQSLRTAKYVPSGRWEFIGQRSEDGGVVLAQYAGPLTGEADADTDSE